MDLNTANANFNPSMGSHAALVAVSELKKWFPVKRGIFSKTSDYIQAVDGVSLLVGAGETLGLVGESGCGKTTLGRLLLALEKPSSGEIYFDGIRIDTLKRHEMNRLRRRMQVIFQDPLSSLNPRLTIMDIVTEGLVQFRMIEGSIKDHAIRLVREVGLSEDAIFRYPHEFSGGQRQRISIARAISLKPDFIVCDEAVSALDASVQAQVINLLNSLKEQYGLSYLFISHDLSVVSNIADRIAVMYLGKIVEIGETADIIQNPLHPYTQALISAVPVPGREKPVRIVLKGETPSPMSPPAGCRFHPRCAHAMPVCSREIPNQTRLESRAAWCHLLNAERNFEYRTRNFEPQK
jgi:oligopeptide/dipeptide ABC transporter ATP-binding protein